VGVLDCVEADETLWFDEQDDDNDFCEIAIFGESRERSSEDKTPSETSDEELVEEFIRDQVEGGASIKRARASLKALNKAH
jgi:hypothetical protein